MRDDDRARHELLAKLEAFLGPDQAATLMEHLPPRPWSELATKDDVGAIASDVRTLKVDVSELQVDVTELQVDVSVLKTDVAELKTDVSVLKTDVAELKTDVSVLKTDVAELKTDVSVLKTDVAELKTDVSVLKVDVAGLKVDVAGLHTEMRAGFAHLGEVLDLRFATQHAQFESFVRERVDSQTKLLVFALVGTLLTTAGIALGAVSL